MQRATASTPPNQRGGPHTPSTEPALKRRKTNDASTRSSPSVSSTPGTLYAAESRSMQHSSTSTPEFLRRIGTNTFTRGEGADTEWVLDLKLPAVAPRRPQPRSIRSNHGTNGGEVSVIPGLGEVDDDDNDNTSEDEEGQEQEEEDIWQNQPAGRQTYGSFKRKGKTSGKQKNANAEAGDDEEDDEELSSASNSASESDHGSDSDSDDLSPSWGDEDGNKNLYGRQHHHKQKQHGTGSSKPTRNKKDAADDSDEEMRKVRRAMEQKHDRIAGTGGGKNAGGRGMMGGSGRGGGSIGVGRKRQRKADDHHSYKDKTRSKKARKTI